MFKIQKECLWLSKHDNTSHIKPWNWLVSHVVSLDGISMSYKGTFYA